MFTEFVTLKDDGRIMNVGVSFFYQMTVVKTTG